MAVRFTKPRPGSRYKDPAAVKHLYRQAKLTGAESDWKVAHKARRKAQVEWRTAKTEQAASGNWQEYKNLKTKGGSEWTVHFVQAAEDNKQDPMKWTVGHFRLLFQKKGPRHPPEWNKDIDTGEHFTLQDLREAIQRGRHNKSVGEDLVSFELLQGLCEDPSTEEAFLQWMERLRCGEELPEAWLRTVVTLLPKTEKPRGPGDLRPISVGAAAAKIFGTMLLMRTRRHLHPLGPAQCAHNGRQTCDYLFAAVKSFALDTEWKLGLSWCRIDIRKAFDTLGRDRTLQILRDRLPPHMFLEYKCWERLFFEGTAVLRTPWGDATIPQGRGIRQGSVESPFLFAIAVETALYDAMNRPTWPSAIPAAPDMPLAELLFMDDTLLWSSSKDTMVLKYDLLREELLKWGLRVNPEKTAYYHSPHSLTPGPITLSEEIIQPAANLAVFGIPLAVPLRPTELMDTAMAKATKKFYANLEVFTARRHGLNSAYGRSEAIVSPAIMNMSPMPLVMIAQAMLFGDVHAGAEQMVIQHLDREDYNDMTPRLTKTFAHQHYDPDNLNLRRKITAQKLHEQTMTSGRYDHVAPATTQATMKGDPTHHFGLDYPNIRRKTKATKLLEPGGNNEETIMHKTFYEMR
ncbi:unnamed protein product [Symbiodinium sp. CCMP2592]|nr:unnamed protein product [Symbiodinium sp. CCMP2592]